MNVFDIIGPIMIGPSSSHTAGAVRLGRVANKLMDGQTPARLDITLSGSFARTGRGHGTDRALLAGIMGYHSYSEEIRDALAIASGRGIDYRFIRRDIPDTHPNTARVEYVLPNGERGSVQGASIGGGNIRVDLVAGDVDYLCGVSAPAAAKRMERKGGGDFRCDRIRLCDLYLYRREYLPARHSQLCLTAGA